MHALNVYYRLIGVQIRSKMQYRFSFWLELLGTVVSVGAEFSSVALVFGAFQTIKGWTLAEVAFLYGMVELAFGAMDLFFSGFDPRDFGTMVRLGKFDQLLLRPVNITIQVFGSNFPIRRMGKITLGAGIFLYALSANPIHWTALKVIYLPLVLVGMFLFFGGLFIIGATITFWTIESIEAMNVLTYGGAQLVQYPMHIYPLWMRRFFTFVVPAIFLNYYPALFYLDKPDPFNFPPFAPFLAPLAGLGMFAAALAFWRFGLGYYQSTGT